MRKLVRADGKVIGAKYWAKKEKLLEVNKNLRD